MVRLPTATAEITGAVLSALVVKVPSALTAGLPAASELSTRKWYRVPIVSPASGTSCDRTRLASSTVRLP